jgi:PEP-CTERM motif
MYRSYYSILAMALCAIAPSIASAVVIYNDDFNADTSANYNTFVTAGATGPSGDSTFAYNYGAALTSGGLAIPAAPHTTDGSTIGLRVRTDNLQNSVGTIVGATEVVTKTLTLPSTYTVQVDVWSNYIGNGTNISASGSNGSTGVAVGIGTAGTSITYLTVANDGMIVEAFGDNGGGADGAYRVYPNTTSPRPVPTNSNYYAAGTTAGSATFSNAYYTSAFPSVSAPAAQATFLATQSGSTPAGVQGFAWHTWTITNDGTNVKWSIDGTLITTVPLSAMTFGGSQVSLGNSDGGLTGNSAANNQLLNAQIFDNLKISDLGLAGDYNQDLKVDAADYVEWKKAPASFGGDPGGYNVWRTNFGNPASAAGSGGSLGANSVPEPTSVTILMMGLAAFGMYRRK